MSKSIIYAVNTNAQSFVATGTTVNFGTTVRRYGSNCQNVGGTITLDGAGYYDVDTNITAIAGGAGTITVNLYKDGTAVTGATTTITVESGSQYAISIPCVVRNTCCCENTLTAVVSGVAGTVANASIVVEKL